MKYHSLSGNVFKRLSELPLQNPWQAGHFAYFGEQRM
jgi:hypothetical protein